MAKKKHTRTATHEEKAAASSEPPTQPSGPVTSDEILDIQYRLDMARGVVSLARQVVSDRSGTDKGLTASWCALELAEEALEQLFLRLDRRWADLNSQEAQP